MHANTNRIASPPYRTAFSLIAAVSALTAMLLSAAPAAAQIPQIPAALPYADSLDDTEPLPFDGTWRIAENNRKYRVQGGAFIADQDYVDLFVFKVMADMVVAAQFEPNDEGGYTGTDVGFKIPWTVQPTTRGLRITVHSILGPLVLNARPLEIDDRAAYDAWSRGEPVDVADGGYEEEEVDTAGECQIFRRTADGFVCAD